jgi:hypothetical protein
MLYGYYTSFSPLLLLLLLLLLYLLLLTSRFTSFSGDTKQHFPSLEDVDVG